jgi:hypothetical protein
MVMSDKTEYLHWSVAGGPNECEHGYAEGIPCPNCDVNPRLIELRAEVDYWRDACGADHIQRVKTLEAEIERLLVELTHRVGWEERCLRAEVEIERLRELHDRHCAFKDCRERTTPHTSIA